MNTSTNGILRPDKKKHEVLSRIGNIRQIAGAQKMVGQGEKMKSYSYLWNWILAGSDTESYQK